MQIKTEKAHFLSAFSFQLITRRRLVLRLVVLLTAHLPEVCIHGLLAVGEVALCEEGLLVGSDLGQVLFTRLYHRTDSLEALTSSNLFHLERSGAVVRGSRLDVEAQAVRVLRRSFAVRTDNVVTVNVTGFLRRFGHCTAYGVNTGSISNVCHSDWASLNPDALGGIIVSK